VKGFYVYLTQDGITIIRWFRDRDKAEGYWRDVLKHNGEEARIRGDAAVLATMQ